MNPSDVVLKNEIQGLMERVWKLRNQVVMNEWLSPDVRTRAAGSLQSIYNELQQVLTV